MTRGSRRVGVVTTSYPREPGDPAGHFVAAEVAELARGGVEVVVIVPEVGTGPPPVPARDATWRGPERVTVIGIPAGGAFGAPGAMARLRESPVRALGATRFVLGARAALRKRGPFDAVIAHWVVPSGWPIAIDASGTLEVVVHGSDAELLIALPRAVRNRILTALLARQARFRFVSRALRDRLVAAGPPGLDASSTVRPATLAMPDIPERDPARVALGLAPADRVIVIVGRLVPDKRPLLAVGAASLVPGARVIVIGDGPERSRLECAHPGATLVGALPRSEALTWIAAADLLLSASLREGAPTVIREARRLGVPVVTTPVGDVAEWAANDPGIVVVNERSAITGSPGGRV